MFLFGSGRKRDKKSPSSTRSEFSKGKQSPRRSAAGTGAVHEMNPTVGADAGETMCDAALCSVGNGANRVLLGRLVNQPDFADVTLQCIPAGKRKEKTGKDKNNKAVKHGHWFILRQRCPVLAKRCSEPDSNGRRCAKVSVDSQTLHRLLRYLYTDALEHFDDDGTDQVEILDTVRLHAAAMAFRLPRLTWLCLARVKELLTLDMAVDVLRSMSTDRQNDMKNLVMVHVLKNREKIVASKELVQKLGIELFSEIIQSQPDNTFSRLDVEVEPTSTLDADFQTIYEEMNSADLTFSFGDSSILAHKAIVGNFGQQLHEHCRRPSPLGGFPRTNGEALSADAVDVLLRWMYYRAPVERSDVAQQLYLFGCEFQIPALCTAFKAEYRQQERPQQAYAPQEYPPLCPPQEQPPDYESE